MPISPAVRLSDGVTPALEGPTGMLTLLGIVEPGVFGEDAL
jgi:hypothetical protein